MELKKLPEIMLKLVASVSGGRYLFFFVIPAKAGIHCVRIRLHSNAMDPDLRRGDEFFIIPPPKSRRSDSEDGCHATLTMIKINATTTH